jgi:hypothetical protein
VGDFFHEKFAPNGERVDDHERLPEVRAHAAAGYALGAGAAEAHVRPRGQRTLSLKARRAIARAQRKRWRLQKQASRPRLGRGHLNPAQRKRSAAGVASYWAKMTQAERDAEMLRRKQVAAKKKAAAA